MVSIPDVTGLSLREAAVAYARAGLYVGPTHVSEDAKNPGYLLGTGWQHKTSNDPEVVDGWFEGRGKEEWHRRDVPIDGVYLHVGRSGLVALDVDNSDYMPSWLVECFETTAPAVQFSNESRKKFHAVFDANGVVYSNSIGSFVNEPKWLDVRGKNGILMLEPSPHLKEGGRYWWVSREVPAIPELISTKLKESKTAAEPFQTVDDSHGLGTRVAHGERDDVMFKYCASLRARKLGWTEALVLATARAKDLDNADGRVTEEFVRTKLDNAWHYEAGTTAEQSALSPADEELFWKSRDELQHIRDFARAQYASPWAVLAITLARMLLMVPPQYVIPATIGSKASFNLFVALCGKSGAGKSTAKDVSDDAVVIEDEPPTLNLGSGEGLSKLFVRLVKKEGRDKRTKVTDYEQYRTAVFLQEEEIGTLGAISSRNATLGPSLRKAWDGRQLGQSNRADDTTLIVKKHSYRLCFWIGVQPSSAHLLLDDGGVGMPQRFVWVSATDPDRPEGDLSTPEPMSWSLPPFPRGKEEQWVDTSNWSEPIELCDTAVRDIRKARADVNAEREGLDGHLLLCQVKVAAALGLLNRHWDVTEEDWALAGQVMAHSNGVRAALVAVQHEKARRSIEAQGKVRATHRLMEEAAIEDDRAAKVARVAAKLHKLVAASPEGLTTGEMSRKLNPNERALRGAAIEHLGDLLTQERVDPHSHSTSVRYRLSERG